MTLSRVRSRPTAPADAHSRFRRRHPVLLTVLALHVPAVAVLAHGEGRSTVDLVAGGAVVLLGEVVLARLGVAARLRATALAVGLGWAALMVILLLGPGAASLVHTLVVGLAAVGHLVASWDVVPDAAAGAGPGRGTGDGTRGGARPEEAGVVPGPDPAGSEESRDGRVEVRDIYTGVWTARRLVPPRTQLVRLPDTPADHRDASRDGDRGRGSDAGDPGRGPDAEDRGSEGPAEEDARPPEVEARDPELTREVLAALHAGALGEEVGSSATESPASTRR